MRRVECCGEVWWFHGIGPAHDGSAYAEPGKHVIITRAIVEDSRGRLRTVDLMDVKFLDPPEEKVSA